MTDPLDTLNADLRRCRRGDEDAARRLYAHAGSAMEMVAMAITNDHAQALDVVQSALLRVLETPTDRIDAVREALPWLLKITRNTALNQRRSDQRRSAREHDSTALTYMRAPTNSAPDDLMRSIAALELDHREIIILRHFIGLTWAQIGATIGLTDRACAARHTVALDQLRNALTNPTTAERGASPC